MPDSLMTDLLSPEEAARQATTTTAPNGLRYATLGPIASTANAPNEVARMAEAVPRDIVAGLAKYLYLFVPLALSGGRLDGDDATAFSATDRTLIASSYDASLLEKAICHRNAQVGGLEYVFISSRLHSDRFALAFEFFINVAHNFTDAVGVPESFGGLLWRQAGANVRGETSVDAWESRAAALGMPPGELERRGAVSPAAATDEKARTEYFAVGFADALAIYLLSLHMDFDYADLREREYPLLAAPALAERLRAVNKLFPPNEGYQFQILYRHRG